MSEISNHKKERADKLVRYMVETINGDGEKNLVEELDLLNIDFQPEDILYLFDKLYDQKITTEEMKKPSNRLFNILHKSLDSIELSKTSDDSIIYWLLKDNIEIDKILRSAREFVVQLNKSDDKKSPKKELLQRYKSISKIDKHYIVKENVLFPLLEKEWEFSSCLKLMWSYHDDVRAEIKQVISLLEATEFDLKQFNKLIGSLYFNIYTIIYREEKVLYPYAIKTIEQELAFLLKEGRDLGFSFIDSEEIKNIKSVSKEKLFTQNVVLETGNLTIKQLELLFKHLPVDMTFVDENDEVCFYSDPPHRVFPRTPSIVGRKVQNCHPPESVDIVEKILAEFKSGNKSVADFWIKMGPKMVYIRYFAMRDENNNYKGTLEVSQEVSGIQALEGERRLLDWD
jgi:DUF438 domain-containing protein